MSKLILVVMDMTHPVLVFTYTKAVTGSFLSIDQFFVSNDWTYAPIYMSWEYCCVSAVENSKESSLGQFPVLQNSPWSWFLKYWRKGEGFSKIEKDLPHQQDALILHIYIPLYHSETCKITHYYCKNKQTAAELISHVSHFFIIRIISKPNLRYLHYCSCSQHLLLEALHLY